MRVEYVPAASYDRIRPVPSSMNSPAFPWNRGLSSGRFVVFKGVAMDHHTRFLEATRRAFTLPGMIWPREMLGLGELFRQQ